MSSVTQYLFCQVASSSIKPVVLQSDNTQSTSPLTILSTPSNCSTNSSPCDLAVDGGMESYFTACSGMNITHLPSGWLYGACYWQLPGSGTSDYFNSCAPTVPLNSSVNAFSNFASFGNSIAPHSGNGYSGLISYNEVFGFPDGQREYITNSLSTNMQAGQTYKVSMYVRLSYHSRFATSNIQMLFSNTMPSQPGILNINPNVGQLINFTTTPITGKTNWILLESCFTPNSDMNYLTIGNFFNDPLTPTIDLDPSGSLGLEKMSYYMIDDVSVIPLVNLGSNLTTCLGAIPLNAGLACLPALTNISSINWTPALGLSSTTILNPIANISSPITYSFSANATFSNGLSCPITDAITINVVNPTSSFSIIPSINPACAGVTTSLTTNATGNVTQVWTDGVTTYTGNTFTVNPTVTTTYSVVITVPLCAQSYTAVQTLTIEPFVSFTVTPNVICESGGCIQITSNTFNNYPSVSGWPALGGPPWTCASSPNCCLGGNSLLGISTLTLDVMEGGPIWQGGPSSGFCLTHTVLSISVISPTNVVTLTVSPQSTTICPGGSTTLNASGASSYTWFPNGANTNSIVVSPTVTTTYTVTGENVCAPILGSSDTQTVQVVVSSLPTLIVSPNFFAFTCPNSPFTFTASGATSYTWTGGTPTQTLSTTNTVVVSPSVTTVYTVTGMNACGLVSTQTISLLVLNITTTASVSPSPICIGQSATLQAGNNGTFTWQPGNLNGATQVVTPTVTTTYTVYGTNTICPGTSTAVVTVSVIGTPIPPFTITNASNLTNICANSTGTNVEQFSTTLSNTAGLTFAWSNGNTNPIATYSMTQSNVISVNVSGLCNTSQTQSICINYINLNCCTFTNAIGNTTYLTSNISNQTIRVAANATITIGGNVVFGNCAFLMGTNSAIVVQPNASLTLRDCKLYSCEGMWYGIKLLNTSVAAASINLRQTTIEDAFNAINADNTTGTVNPSSSISIIANSVFNKNYIDISIQNTATYFGQYPLNFVSSSMQSQSSITSPGTNLKCSGYYSPTIRVNSYAGLFTDRAGIVTFTSSLVSGVIANNTIKNKDYGLFFRRTDANVYNANFSNMLGYLPLTCNTCPPVFPSGVAITSVNAPKFLNVKPPTGTTINTTFSNIGYGVISAKTPFVEVKYCDFNNPLQFNSNFTYQNYGSIGTWVIDGVNLTRIDYNKFNRTYSPIIISYSVAPTPSTHTMSASNNNITATGTGTIDVGIMLQSAVASNNVLGIMAIANNSITNANIGIRAINLTSGLRISGNTIVLNTHSTQLRVGIHLNGANNGLMADNNTIDGGQLGTDPTNFSLNSYGILSLLSPGCFIQCNNISQVGRGIAYNGNNLGSGTKMDFFKNRFKDPIRQGFVLMNGGIIGQQGDANGVSANVWINFNTLNSDHTVVGGLPGASAAINSMLYVRSVNTFNAMERITDNQFSPPSSSPNAYAYGPSLTLMPTFTPDKGSCLAQLYQGYRIIVTPTVNTIDRNEEYSNVINAVTTTTTSLSPQEKWSLKQHLYKTIRKQGVGNTNTVENFYRAQKNTELAQYLEIDSLLSESNTTLAKEKNNSISANNSITQTYKKYNAIYLSGVSAANEYTTLKELANLCPTLYGNAVFEARALLNMVSYATLNYNDSCGEENLATSLTNFEEQQLGVSLIEKMNVSLLPNPNNGEFTLAYDLRQTNKAIITISDITGKVVYTNEITNEFNLVKISTIDLNNGMYFIHLNSNDKLLWTNKFIIQH